MGVNFAAVAVQVDEADVHAGETYFAFERIGDILKGRSIFFAAFFLSIEHGLLYVFVGEVVFICELIFIDERIAVCVDLDRHAVIGLIFNFGIDGRFYVRIGEIIGEGGKHGFPSGGRRFGFGGCSAAFGGGFGGRGGLGGGAACVPPYDGFGGGAACKRGEREQTGECQCVEFSEFHLILPLCTL